MLFRSTKELPVVPELDGEPAAGFEVGTVTADPGTVEVVGPASALGILTEAITEPVSVAGASDVVTETVTIGVSDPSVRVRTSTTARVTANIRPAPAEWAVREIVVDVRNGGRSVVIAPREVTVHVRGPRESMRFGALEFNASIDVGGLRPGQYDLPVQVAPPERIGVVRVDPAAVRVVIE